MKRVYHPWNKWEDFRYNFYGGDNSYKKSFSLEVYADMLRDLPKFEAALQTIIKEWPYACEHNLTNTSLNQVAYMGQAACALLFRVPSMVSCAGYNLLTPEEQKAADAMAQKYIDIWLSEYERRQNVSA